jgi:miniconductance mechanosensitive channel
MEEIVTCQQTCADKVDSPLDGPQVTNIEVFRKYIEAYLMSREDIHREGMDLLVRSLAPSPDGLPVEVYVFTKSTVWKEYETSSEVLICWLLCPVLTENATTYGLDFSQMVAHSRSDALML